jgi:hypothetical protein
MTRERRIEDEVDKTLGAYGQDPVLEVNPYLLTRIEAARKNLRQTKRVRVLPRVTFGFVVVVLLLLVNLFTVVMYELRRDRDLDARLVSQLQSDLQMDQTPF